jgi:5-methylcytosine-specific restriction endonuclease McrA
VTDVTPILKAKKRSKKSKTPMDVADELFAKVIKVRDQRCTECGDTFKLQCAHIFSRRYHAIRCDERNAVALCAKCHMFFTHRPIEEERWRQRILGPELYRELEHLALTAGKKKTAAEWRQIHADLRDRLDRLERS